MHENSIPGTIGGKSGQRDKQTKTGTIQGNPGRLASMHILSRAVNFSLLAGPNPSEQKPNQTNKRLVCSYIAQRQQQKLGCYFELFCNGLSSIITRTVATHPRSRTLHLRLLRGSSWTKLKSLCFHGKALSAMEAVVEVLFNL